MTWGRVIQRTRRRVLINQLHDTYLRQSISARRRTVKLATRNQRCAKVIDQCFLIFSRESYLRKKSSRSTFQIESWSQVSLSFFSSPRSQLSLKSFVRRRHRRLLLNCPITEVHDQLSSGHCCPARPISRGSNGDKL